MTRPLNERGAVYAEFLVAFLPFFLLFLGAVQIALIAQARIVVQHAASLAARAAVVTIDDDPVFYDDGERKRLSESGNGSGSDRSQKLLEKLSDREAPGSADGGESAGSERLNRVRNAAYLPLAAVSPSYEDVSAWFGAAVGARSHSIGSAIGDAPLARVLTGLALYTRVASAVTFPKARGSRELRSLDKPFGNDDVVRVRVTYLFPCAIPLVRQIACRSLIGMRVASALPVGESDAETADSYAQARDELEHAEWKSLQNVLYALPHESFIVLRGEAALPNQGAPYLYPSQLCKTKKSAPGVDCRGKR